MKSKRRAKADPLEQQIELSLDPGEFIHYSECFSFVSDLEEVVETIDKLIATDPARAAALYESFLAGCHAKAEELDDSSGSFGQFAETLICRWIKARQAAGTGPEETASTLLAWMDDDPHAFFYGIEKELTAALNNAGLAALETLSRARFEAASEEPAGHEYRRWGGALRAIYCARRNIPAYIALAEQTGLKPEDCLAVARLFAPRKPEEALAWVERGRALDRKTPYRSGAAYDLDKLHRELLTRLGRQNEALEAAWADFREHPSTFTYVELMKYVPKAKRCEWREKALDTAKGAELGSLLELLIEIKEMERLAELVRGSSDEALQKISHFVTEPAAKRLEKTHPDLAARLWCAQGMRIVNAGKSTYYDAALSNFSRARDCYRRAGLTAEWEQTVGRVCAAHKRKTGFIGGFQAVAAGAEHRNRPSFLDLAKARWGARHPGGDR